jgi:tRNA A-37 threonylcarbamoyl transferase component Bud32
MNTDDQQGRRDPLDAPADASNGGGARGMEGATLDGRYLIERELGRGGIGAVYFARDQKLLGKPVVIKILLEQLGDEETAAWVRRKFRQEIEALARLDHPGVVGVLHAGELADGRPYIVMQYIEGSSLRSAMRREGVAFARVANIFRQVGHALSNAHEHGIFHRDLKPENIMLQSIGEEEEYVKLIDFGIATVRDSTLTANHATTEVAGTVAYMAPEQLLGRPSAASDIFALGVIAYEMLTGSRPFNPPTPYQIMEELRAGVRVRPKELRADLPAEAEDAIIRALSYEERDRQPRARDFCEQLARSLDRAALVVTQTQGVADSGTLVGQTLPAQGATFQPAITRSPTLGSMTAVTVPARVALLYKRSAQLDEQLLGLLETELRAQGCSVFVDRHLTIGVEWAKEIERQLREADAVIPLVSEHSMASEMLAYELQIASESAQQRGKPRILPVRVAYEGPLPDPLAGILAPIQYALWNGPEDDRRLADELLGALRSPESAALGAERQIEPPGGAVPLDSRFYLVRPTDGLFLDAIRRRDSIVLVKGARQMGKTSLLARGLQQAREAGARVVVTDFQKLNQSDMESVESFFKSLGGLVADQLDLDVYPEDVWKERRAPSVNFERYVRREVLEKVGGPLVWGMDEVDRLFTCPFGGEVFGLFRTWHNERAVDPTAPWGQLTLAIAYATEAHLFITDQNQSPFNVGTRLELKDFTPEQVSELNVRHGSPLKGAEELGRFYSLLGGHPYLVRRGLHEMVSNGIGFDEFEASADREEGPFGDHLRRIMMLLGRDPVLADIARAVLKGYPCPTDEAFYRLRSAGVMSGDTPQELKPRCRLYAVYLERHLF